MSKTRTPTCPECGNAGELVGGIVLYPHRPDLFHKRFYICREHNAYVGCHEGTEQPYGTMATEPMRRARNAAHAAFDPIWRTKQLRRKDAYAWLAKQVGVEFHRCHIGEFSIDQCKRVVAACEQRAVSTNDTIGRG